MTINVHYAGRVVTMARGETVLEGLERAGIDAPSSCRAGACQCCLLRVIEGAVPPKSQEGLKPALKASGHFLACVGRPDSHLVCEPASAGVDFRGAVKLVGRRLIAQDVALVTFARPDKLTFVPGQFVSLRSEAGPARSYSLASAGGGDTFDIHVRRIPHGKMSTWLHDHASAGDVLWAEGPKGDCMYYPGQVDQPLTFVGTGTGIAPMYAIAQEALRQGHKGHITIYQGALTEDRLYFVDELSTLAATETGVSYIRCVLRGPASPGIVVGDLKDLVVKDFKGSGRYDARSYLCGDPGIVRDLKKQLFLAGLSLRQLHADAFVGSTP